MTPQERLDYLLAEVWQPTNRGIVLRDIYTSAGDRLQAFRESLSSWDGSGEEPVL